MDIEERIRSFVESETRSGSMDFGCITPEYVQRMLGGVYSIEEIRPVLRACLKEYHDGKGIY